MIFGSEGTPSAPSFLVESPPFSQVYAQSDCFGIAPEERYAFDVNLRVISGFLANAWVAFYSDASCADVHGELGVIAYFTEGSWKSLSRGSNLYADGDEPRSARITLRANTGTPDPARILFDGFKLRSDKVFDGGFDSAPGEQSRMSRDFP